MITATLLLACIISLPNAKPANIEVGEYDIVWQDGKTYPVRFLERSYYARKHGEGRDAEWRWGHWDYDNRSGILYITEKYRTDDGVSELKWRAYLKTTTGKGKDMVIEGVYSAPFKGKLKISKKRTIKD